MEEFLDPEKVLKRLDLKEDMVAADFGCGSGGWVLPLAKILKKGKVFAIDILEEPLSALRGKMKFEGISNIEIKKSDVEKSSLLLSESCDLVLMTNLLFEVEDIKKVLEEGKRVLKTGGKILIVDWKKDAPFGPEKRILPEKVKEIALSLGFSLEDEFDAGSYHWGLVLKK
jgi:ubiquinone/menaquinone biosynthesis C-methylase UbiE